MEALHALVVDVEHVGADHPVGAGRARLAGGQQVDGAVVLEQRDARVRAGALDQHPLDLGAGGVPVVQDPAVGVAALAGEVEVAAAVADRVEVGAELQQGLDHGRAPLDHPFDHVSAAQAGPGGHGVLDVGLEGVVLVDHGGDPALSPVRGRVDRPLLGDDRDVGELGHLEGVEEAGDAAPQDEDVETVGIVQGHSRPARRAKDARR